MAIAFKWISISDNTLAGFPTAAIDVGVTNAASSPGSVAAGDFLIMGLMLFTTTTDTIGVPAGWTQLPYLGGSDGLDHGNGAQMAFYRHQATGGETASYHVTQTGSGTRYWAWALMCYSGVDTSTPIDDAYTFFDSGGGGTVRVPNSGTLTATAASDMFVLLFEQYFPTTPLTLTFPGGMTVRQALASQGASSGFGSVAAAEQLISSTGSVGPFTVTTEAFRNYNYTGVLLKAGSGGAGPAPGNPGLVGLLGD